MALITLPFETAKEQLGKRSDTLGVIRSSRSSCVVSGTIAAVEEYVEFLNDKGGVLTWKV
jgi:6-methylsalicylic acid synthase